MGWIASAYHITTKFSLSARLILVSCVRLVLSLILLLLFLLEYWHWRLIFYLKPEDRPGQADDAVQTDVFVYRLFDRRDFVLLSLPFHHQTLRLKILIPASSASAWAKSNIITTQVEHDRNSEVASRIGIDSNYIGRR